MHGCVHEADFHIALSVERIENRLELRFECLAGRAEVVREDDDHVGAATVRGDRFVICTGN